MVKGLVTRTKIICTKHGLRTDKINYFLYDYLFINILQTEFCL